MWHSGKSTGTGSGSAPGAGTLVLQTVSDIDPSPLKRDRRSQMTGHNDIGDTASYGIILVSSLTPSMASLIQKGLASTHSFNKY